MSDRRHWGSSTTRCASSPAAALRAALEQQNLDTRDAERPPLDHRFVTVDPGSGRECTVEVFADGGRLEGCVILDIGTVLHPDDLAADKGLALWGRARPRDFFDVHALLHHYEPGRLLDLAALKDRGFTRATFLDALSAIARLTPDDWTEDGIDATAVDQLRSTGPGFAVKGQGSSKGGVELVLVIRRRRRAAVAARPAGRRPARRSRTGTCRSRARTAHRHPPSSL